MSVFIITDKLQKQSEAPMADIEACHSDCSRRRVLHLAHIRHDRIALLQLIPQTRRYLQPALLTDSTPTLFAAATGAAEAWPLSPQNVLAQAMRPHAIARVHGHLLLRCGGHWQVGKHETWCRFPLRWGGLRERASSCIVTHAIAHPDYTRYVSARTDAGCRRGEQQWRGTSSQRARWSAPTR